MACNCNQQTNYNLCNPKPCQEPQDCSCPTILSTDCVTYGGNDLECSGIVTGQTLTETIEQLDTFICEKVNDITNALTLKNIGDGAKVYKGDDLLGRKELRTVTKTGNLVTVTENTNDIAVSIDESALNTFIEANQKTYSVANVGTDPLRVNVYKDSTIVGDHTQFNFRSIVSSDSSVEITNNTNEIDLKITIPPQEQTYVIGSETNTVTGTGTVLNPYKIEGKLYQAGSNISITGSGTTLSPYIISVNNTNDNVGWLKGDTKEVVCDNTYIDNNFTISGLGINERVGWAILNGSTHTYNGNIITVPNDNGRTVIAYGINYSTLEAIGGNKDAVVVEHSHSISTSPNDELGYVTSKASSSTGGTPINTSTVGESGIDKNMQPYVVRLRIMKL